MTAKMDPNLNEMNVAEENLKESLEVMYSDVYKKYIRDIQRQSYLCAADCCKNFINQKEVAKCSEQCQDKLRKVFDKFDKESEAMNNHLARGIMSCQEKERKKYNRDYIKLNPSEKKDFDESFTKCAVKCFEESTNDLPKLKERLLGFVKDI
ncbi:hypothetical protein ACQ4LE_003286 [Meloidogyne hapla]|uniref:Zf-Tim10_DDP domain-containing protein n=1 Tax=Meloidogyne hapla TaxID=6305 RepID=A0A1I8BW89_MELHA